MRTIFKTFFDQLNESSKDILLIVMGVALMAIGSQIVIPLHPVPITLQTVSLMGIALTYRSKAAFQAILAYIILGAAGLPIFAQYTCGFHVLLGLKGGYYFGFVACAMVISALQSRFGDNHFWRSFLYVLAGTSVIYIFGVTQLAFFIGLHKAWMLGFMPFILPGIIKALLLSGLVRVLR